MSTKYITLFISLIICIININLISAELARENVVLAINCGGEEYKDSKDILYEADKYFTGGQPSDFGTQFEIKLAYDGVPYQTERWGEADFSYKLPIENPGKYTIVLKFSEVYFNSANEKVFDISLGKKKVVGDIDIYGKVGKSTAFDKYVEFELKKGGKVYFGGKLVEGAYDESDHTIDLVFNKGQRDNPKVNAIVLVKGGIENTDYENFKNQVEELEKEKLEKERKQREIKKRNNLHYDFEDFEEDYVDPDIEARSRSKIGPMFFVIIGLIGALIYFIFIRTKNDDDDEEEGDEEEEEHEKKQ